ncbi:hypothetical protein [Paludibacterium yongneupense]|uniref:hypothetical protein n=1 Tax=Paludibacterium yongneupense TaxID=400061 RepID=UPI00040ADD6E|nr:hypothetical protein [Paludibacterium yongneupense]
MLTAKQKKYAVFGLALLMLAAVKFALIGWYLHSRSAVAAVQTVSCKDAVCALPGGGRLRFVTPPRHGQAFELRVEGVETKSATAEFTMRDMDMGFNRYRFVKQPAAWQARVMLPLCVTGRREWTMTLILDDARYRLPFRVD